VAEKGGWLVALQYVAEYDGLGGNDLPGKMEIPFLRWFSVLRRLVLRA